MSENPNPYAKGIGHVLAEDHDPDSCLACAYGRGFDDARSAAEWVVTSDRPRYLHHRGCAHFTRDDVTWRRATAAQMRDLALCHGCSRRQP
jgi:hypothetical protein